MTIQILQGNSLEIMPTLEPASVSLVLADPPYKVSQGKKNIDRSKWTTKAARSRILVRDFGEWDREWPTNGAFWGWMRCWLTQAKILLRPGGWAVVFCTSEAMGQLARVGEAAGLQKRQGFTWAKENPAPGFVNAKMYAYGTEAAVIFRKPGSPVTWNAPIGTRNWLATPSCAGAERSAHPCQKPLDLLEPFVVHLTNPGDLVVDPFSGSGSVAVACQRLGRRCIGIEADPKYVQIAHDRLAVPTPGSSLPIFQDLWAAQS